MLVSSILESIETRDQQGPHFLDSMATTGPDRISPTRICTTSGMDDCVDVPFGSFFPLEESMVRSNCHYLAARCKKYADYPGSLLLRIAEGEGSLTEWAVVPATRALVVRNHALQPSDWLDWPARSNSGTLASVPLSCSR